MVYFARKESHVRSELTVYSPVTTRTIRGHYQHLDEPPRDRTHSRSLTLAQTLELIVSDRECDRES